MGGPKAWKEMQQRQKKLQCGWDVECPQPNSDDEVAESGKKKGFYADYDTNPQSINEMEMEEPNNGPEDNEEVNDQL
jgi:hypothetical protein